MTNWYLKSKTIKAIVSPETAKRLNIQRDLPVEETFNRAIQNTKGARITEDGLEIELTRNQHLEEMAAHSFLKFLM